MEEKRSSMQHRIVLSDREEMSVTGVADVISFDEQNIIVETDLGILEIRGIGLHVNQLSLESGEMSLSGEIVSVEYDERGVPRKGGGSLLSRLFG